MNLYIFRRLGGILFLALMFCLFLCSMAGAGVKVVQIDKPKIRLSVLPGRSATGTIRVSNNSDVAKHIKAYIEDWVYLPGGDGSKEFLPAGTTELSAADWIDFAPAEFAILPYGTKDINYTVRVHEGGHGGHYAVLFFEGLLGEPPDARGGVLVPIAVRIGALFYIEAKGTIDRKASLKNVKLFRESSRTPLEITADFVNRGNVDITVNGTFYIIDKQGRVYGRGRFNQGYTFPNDTVRLYATCKEPISHGFYDVVITLEIGKGETLIEEIRLEVGSDGEVSVL